MKMANKYLVLVLGGSLIASCADLDTIPEGGTFTNEQKQQVVEMMPERLQADVTGMFLKYRHPIRSYSPVPVMMISVIRQCAFLRI